MIKIHIKYIILTFLCLTIYNADAQGFVNFPTATMVSGTSTIVSADGNEMEVQLRMMGATPTRANQTICTGFVLPETDTIYMFQFAGKIDSSKVHHMGLYACSIVPNVNPCKCPMENRSPLFSWSRFTPAVRFTGDETNSFGVFRVGKGTDRTFLFLESHYHHAFTDPDTSGINIRMTYSLNTNPPAGHYYELAIFPLMGTGTIPANSASYNIDTCVNIGAIPASWSVSPAVIGFQSHTHNLGRVVSSTHSSSNIPTMTDGEFGVGNPLWPNAYVAIGSPAALGNSNLFSRCVYTSTGVSNNTNTNGNFQTKTVWNEMCLQSLIVARKSDTGPWPSTTPAFLTGKCNSTQSAVLDSILPSTFPGATNADLDTYAFNGTGTGSFDYTTSDNNYNINLGTQTFKSFFDAA